MELSHVAASAVLSNANSNSSSESPGPASSGIPPGGSPFAQGSVPAASPSPIIVPAPCTPGAGTGRPLTSNGLSFDSDRFEFREFVDVASQASLDREVSDRAREDLQDAVTAYEMQNRLEKVECFVSVSNCFLAA